MRFVCRNFSLSDLPRRGLAPQEAPPAVLLLDIEAELSIWEDGRLVWSEESFPVAELAYHLALWLRSPAAGHTDFEFDSIQEEAPGLIRVRRSDQGWRVGSHRTPGFWSAPVERDVLLAELGRFDRSVRTGITGLGIEPAFLPKP